MDIPVSELKVEPMLVEDRNTNSQVTAPAPHHKAATAASCKDLQDLPPTLTVEQAAKVLGIGRGSAYRAARRGELPTIRIGWRLLVPTAQLLRLLGVEDEP